MIGALVGGGLGLIGVISTIIFSYKLNKSNQNFQREINSVNQRFQIEIKDKEQDFELKLVELQKANQIWFEKYKLFIQLMSFKHEVGSKEFTSALNGVPALFHDSKKVIDSLNEFYSIASRPREQKTEHDQDQKLINVIYSIYSELGLEEKLGKDLIEKIFNVHKEPLSFYELQHLFTLSRIADTIDTEPLRKQTMIHDDGNISFRPI